MDSRTLKRFIKNKNEKNVIVKGGARDAICAIKVVAATAGEDNIDRIEKKVRNVECGWGLICNKSSTINLNSIN